jgi:hypothetical protein
LLAREAFEHGIEANCNLNKRSDFPLSIRSWSVYGSRGFLEIFRWIFGEFGGQEWDLGVGLLTQILENPTHVLETTPWTPVLENPRIAGNAGRLRPKVDLERNFSNRPTNGNTPNQWEYAQPMGIRPTNGNTPNQWEYAQPMGIRPTNGNTPNQWEYAQPT